MKSFDDAWRCFVSAAAHGESQETFVTNLHKVGWTYDEFDAEMVKRGLSYPKEDSNV